MSIEEAVAEAVEEQVELAIGNLDMSAEIAQEVEDVISHHDFSRVVADHIDYDDIRESIEDDILYQVNDHIDLDYLDIDSHVDVQGTIWSFIFDGCGDMDRAADHILKRGMDGRNDWFIPTKTQWRTRNEGVFTPLATKVAELEATVERLLEVINLADVRTPLEALEDAIDDGELSISDARDAIIVARQERYQTIRYMSKPELVAWATNEGYNVEGMTVKQIHGLVL